MIKTINNIMAPLSQQLVHTLTIVDEEESRPSLCGREFEQILVDTSSCAVEFGWYYDRDVDLALVDAEDYIDRTREELAYAREQFWYKHDKAHAQGVEAAIKFEEWVARQEKKAFELEEYITDLDKSYLVEEEHTDFPSEGAAMYTYLEMYIDTMSLGELAVAMDVLEDMHASKSISWYYYVQCGLAVSHRLNKRCPTWQDKHGRDRGGCWTSTLANLKKHNQVNHTKVASYEDRFYGEMSFSMEDALDAMAKVRLVAEQRNLDAEEVFYSMMENTELEPTLWVPRLEEL